MRRRSLDVHHQLMATFNVTDYGAVPIDATISATPDCRPAMQAAVDACVAAGGGDVLIPDGDWFLTRPPTTAYNRFACLSWHGPGVRLVGAGKGRTRLVVAGDAEARTLIVISCDPGSGDAEISGLTIDTTGLTNTDANEQTHAIQIGSGVHTPQNGTSSTPVRNVDITSVRFMHRGAVGERWGDAIRVVGHTEATAVTNVRCLFLDFVKVGRSAIAGQRNVHHLQIEGCMFYADEIGGGCLDGEATPGSGLQTEWPRGLTVKGCHFYRTLPGGENFFIAMTNQTHFSIVGNVLVGRGVSLVRGHSGVIAGNTIDVDAQHDYGCVELANVVEDVTLANNAIRRRGYPGAVIRCQPHSGKYPGGISITGGTITNETNGAAILLHGTRDVAIGGGLVLKGSGGSASMGVYIDAGGQDVENVTIGPATFRGFAHSCVRLVSAGPTATLPVRTFRAIQVGGCTSVSCGPGVRADNSQYIPVDGVKYGVNNWSTAPTYAPT